MSEEVIETSEHCFICCEKWCPCCNDKKLYQQVLNCCNKLVCDYCFVKLKRVWCSHHKKHQVECPYCRSCLTITKSKLKRMKKNINKKIRERNNQS